MELNNQKSSNKYVYLIIICAFLLNFTSNYPQYQLSPLSYLLMPAYNLDMAQFSSLFSSAMIPGVLLGIIAGVLCDRYGVKACVSIAGIISLAGLIGRIFATDFTVLFICMLLSGIVTSFLNTNLAKIFGTWLPPDKIGTGIGIALAGATASMAVAMGTTAMLPGIRAAFVIAAIASAVSLVLWIIFMKNAPKGENQANSQELPHLSVIEGIKTVIKNRYIWIVGLCLGFVVAASMCLNTFLPQALQTVRNIDAVSAGAMTSAYMFGSLVGAIAGPIVCSKIGRMKLYIIIYSILTGIGVAFSWMAPVGIVLTICLFLTGVFASGLISQMTAIPVMLPGIGPILAGSAGGVVGTIQLICAIVIPSYIITPIVGDNFTLLFIIGGALAIGTAVLTILLPELLGKKN